ncbi:MAG: hypothetical protein MUF10_00645 [Thermoanaerobaculaceae bacterium]|nr:hypothetical protein [Thermoanaerobaculaceae bacterium]
MQECDRTPAAQDRVQVFRMSRFWRVFFAIATPFLLALCVWMASIPFLDRRTGDLGFLVPCLVGATAGFLFMLYSAYSAFKTKLEIYPDRVKLADGFRTTELQVRFIKGFRLLPTQYIQTLVLVPEDPQVRKLKVGLLLERETELRVWLNENLTNLDAVEAEQELETALDDTRLGETAHHRRWVLQSARRLAWILNGGGLAAGLWAMLRPVPYHLAIWTCLAMPLAALLSVRGLRGAIKLDARRGSPLPDVGLAFLMPCLGLALRAVLDWEILTWGRFWSPFLLASISLFVLVLACADDVRRKPSTAIGLLLFCAVYGYGSVILLNGLLDRSAPVGYHARVVEQRVERDKRTSYHLKLSPWGPRTTTQEVDVPRSVYEKHSVGDEVDVTVHEGRLGIQWFTVR